jgi:hypothetical protein
VITPQMLTDRFPELAAKSNTQLTIAIASAYLQMDENVWGGLYDEGAIYLAAALVSSYGVGGGAGSSGSGVVAGPVIRKKVGNVEVQYATSGGSGTAATEGGQTSASAETYFQTYERLLRNLPEARFLVF